MSKKGPIIVVEDDKDEILLYERAFKNLLVPNKILFFVNGKAALEYLATTADKPFIIICDIHMPVMSGFELKEKVSKNKDASIKAIPFIFRSSATSHDEIIKSYNLSIQGFFRKTSDFKSLENQLNVILKYWKRSVEPNVVV